MFFSPYKKPPDDAGRLTPIKINAICLYRRRGEYFPSFIFGNSADGITYNIDKGRSTGREDIRIRCGQACSLHRRAIPDAGIQPSREGRTAVILVVGKPGAERALAGNRKACGERCIQPLPDR